MRQGYANPQKIFLPSSYLSSDAVGLPLLAGLGHGIRQTDRLLVPYYLCNGHFCHRHICKLVCFHHFCHPGPRADWIPGHTFASLSASARNDSNDTCSFYFYLCQCFVCRKSIDCHLQMDKGFGICFVGEGLCFSCLLHP